MGDGHEEELPPEGGTPQDFLFYAVRSQRLSFINTVVSSGEVDMGCTDEHGRTALHLAAERGAVDAVRALLRAGCPVDKKCAGGSSKGKSAVEIASGNPQLRQAFEAEMLQQIGSGNAERVEALLRAGMDVNTSDQATGNTFLHWACIFDQAAIVRVLVGFGGDVNARNLSGDTPLQCAASRAVCDLLTAPQPNSNDAAAAAGAGQEGEGDGDGDGEDEESGSAEARDGKGSDGDNDNEKKEKEKEMDADDPDTLRKRLRRLEMVAEERFHTVQTLRESLSMVLEEKGVMRLVSRLQAERNTLEAQLAETTEVVAHLRGQLARAQQQLEEQRSRGARVGGAAPGESKAHGGEGEDDSDSGSYSGEEEDDEDEEEDDEEEEDEDDEEDEEGGKARGGALQRNGGSVRPSDLQDEVEFLRSRVRTLETQVRGQSAIVVPAGATLHFAPPGFSPDGEDEDGDDQGLLGTLLSALYRRIVGEERGQPEDGSQV